MSGKQQQVITLEQIKEKAKGTIIEIPDWDDPNQTVNVRVRKIDLTTKIMNSGMLPNSLRMAALKAFEGEESGVQEVEEGSESEEDFSKFIELLDRVVEEALVEPKFADIQEIYPLTLQQKMTIFNWVMQEVEELRSFRGES